MAFLVSSSQRLCILLSSPQCTTQYKGQVFKKWTSVRQFRDVIKIIHQESLTVMLPKTKGCQPPLPNASKHSTIVQRNDQTSSYSVPKDSLKSNL